MEKPWSEACERNRDPILDVLRVVLADAKSVLEIGQHAVYFAAALPHLVWQTADLPENHAGIRMWLDEAALSNLRPPLALDLTRPDWPAGPVDAVFTANTLHIVSWGSVQRMFEGIARVLRPGGWFCAYGPFNYEGRFTSESNARFDAMLRQRDADSGIRNFEDVCADASRNGLRFEADHPMPANNRTLVWRKT
jgi:SAM-dependent methyltransferase